MRLIALSGPSGSGKSTALTRLSTKFPLMTTNYSNSEKLGSNGDLIGSKLGYLFAWFAEVTRMAQSGSQIALCDRSPIDCAAYVKHGQSELLRVIALTMEELREREVFVHHVLVHAEITTLMERIVERDGNETTNHRGKISLSMLDSSLQFYTEMGRQWEREVDTSSLSEAEATQKIYDVVNEITSAEENRAL